MSANKHHRRKLVWILLFSVLSLYVTAAKRYWISAATAGWNSTSNWSATSGGAGGSSVPGSSDTCYFDGNGLGRCDIDANVNVKRFEIVSSYTDTITQNAFTITVGSGGMKTDGGIFIGSSSTITLNATFENTGCNFTATSGTFEIKEGHFLLTTAGAFLHNNGLLLLNHASGATTDTCRIDLSTSSNDSSFYDLEFTGSSGRNRFYKLITGGILVNHTFTVSNSGTKYCPTGVIKLLGDFTVSGNGYFGYGSLSVCTIQFAGTGTQTINGGGSTTVTQFPNIEINKPSGTLYANGNICARHSFTLTSGSFNAGTSVLRYVDFLNASITGNFSGSNAFNKVIIEVSGQVLTINDTLQVNDSLIVKTYITNIIKGTNAGVIDAKGHVSIPGNISLFGDARLMFSGSGTQVLQTGKTYTGGNLSGSILSVIIKKSASDTLKLIGNIIPWSSWTYVSGIVESSKAFVIFSSFRSPAITGSHTLRKVEFQMYGTNPVTISSGTELTITDTMVIGTNTTSAGSTLINTGVINLKGDLLINSTSPGSGGSATLKINGTGDQNITGYTSSGTYGRLPKVVIDKSSGTLHLYNTICTGASGGGTSFTLDNGAIDYGTSTLVFANNNTITSNISGNRLDLGNVQITTGTVTINASTTLGVNGNFSTSSSASTSVINGNILECKGNITINNTANPTAIGTATLVINGTGSQTLTGSGLAFTGDLPAVSVNKPSGTLMLASIISAGSDWEYIAGDINPGTSKVYFEGSTTRNVDAQGTSSTMNFYDVIINGPVNLTGDIKIKNILSIQTSSTLAQSTYALSFGGYINNGTHSGTGAIKMIGNGYHSFSKSGGGTTSFGTVTVNRDGGSLKLNAPINITGSMTFNKGILKTTSTNLLKFADNATCSGGSDSGYVMGPVIKTGNDVFVFPLGDTAKSSGRYHPLNISAPSSATDAFTAQYFYTVQTQGATLDSTLDSLSTCQYWYLDRTTGSSNVNVGLGWDSTDCEAAPADTNMRLAQWNSGTSKWLNIASTFPAAKRIQSGSALSTFGYFTLAQGSCYISNFAPFRIIGPYGVCSGHKADLSIESGDTPISYLWSTGSTASAITQLPTVTTTYSVNATLANGCHRTAGKTVNVLPYIERIITTGFDTILAPDSLYYTIEAAGLSEDSVLAGDTSLFCGDLPVIENGTVDLYFYSRTLSDTLHIQYDIDTAGIVSFVRIIQGDNLFPLESDYFSIDQRTINIIPTIINPKILVPQYHKLKRELDGGFLLAKNKRVYFSFEEEYNSGGLNYRILNAGRVPLSSLPSKVRKYGTNQYSIVFPSTVATGVYYLEVTNAKGEVYYMRFKLI